MKLFRQQATVNKTIIKFVSLCQLCVERVVVFQAVDSVDVATIWVNVSDSDRKSWSHSVDGDSTSSATHQDQWYKLLIPRSF